MRLLSTFLRSYICSFSSLGGGERTSPARTEEGQATATKLSEVNNPVALQGLPTVLSSTEPQTSFDNGTSRSSWGDAGGLGTPETVTDGGDAPSSGTTPTKERSAGSGAASSPEETRIDTGVM